VTISSLSSLALDLASPFLGTPEETLPRRAVPRSTTAATGDPTAASSRATGAGTGYRFGTAGDVGETGRDGCLIEMFGMPGERGGDGECGGKGARGGKGAAGDAGAAGAAMENGGVRACFLSEALKEDMTGGDDGTGC